MTATSVLAESHRFRLEASPEDAMGVLTPPTAGWRPAIDHDQVDRRGWSGASARKHWLSASTRLDHPSDA
jgi:hypothetical protein